MLRRPWARRVAFVWACLSAWDLVISQILPEHVAKDAPKLWQVTARLLNMTSGWIPWWGWLILGMALLVVCCVEFAFRSLREERLHHRYSQPDANAEKGFLDFQADGIQAMADLTRITLALNKDTEGFAKGVSKFGNRIKYITNPHWRRRYATRTAKFINTYSAKVQKAVSFIGSVTPVIAENQLGMIEREMDISALIGFAEASSITADQIIPSTITSLYGMKESTASIRGISADLNAASHKLDSVLGKYIDGLKHFGETCKNMQLSALSRVGKLRQHQEAAAT